MTVKGLRAEHGWLLLVPLLLVMAVLLLRDLGNPSLGYPDADRLLMDGVFILDFLRDLPLNHAYEYATQYFAQYPALSIGYRPPFFPFVEAMFNAVLGVSPWSSRLAVFAFAAVGVSAWFRLVARVFDWETAFWATLLLITTPFVAMWGWYTMTELPVLSMAMVTAYVFYRYTETDRPIYIYATAILYSLAAWTKQPAVFLALWFVAYALARGKLVAYAKRKEVWFAAVIAGVLLAPLAVVTLWLGKLNVEQSVGQGGGLNAGVSRLSLENFRRHLDTLGRYHLTEPVLLLSLAGMAWAACKRDARALYFALLCVATYAFFTYLAGKNERYPIFWIPGFALFAALPIAYVRSSRIARLALSGVAAVVVVYQVGVVYNREPGYATGYDEAAAHVLTASRSPTVFFDGYNNGYFTYFMRAQDPDRSMYVLRGDKLLTSSAISYSKWLEVHARNQDDIRRIFDEYGVQMVVVEGEDRSGLPIHVELRRYLREGPFRLVKEIPVASNRDNLERQRLLIYEYLAAKPMTAQYIELHLPVVGQTIRAAVRRPEARLGKG